MDVRLCSHNRWSTIKRWKLGSTYFVMQRCRRCDDWIRRKITLDDNLVMTIERYTTEMREMRKSA